MKKAKRKELEHRINTYFVTNFEVKKNGTIVDLNNNDQFVSIGVTKITTSAGEYHQITNRPLKTFHDLEHLASLIDETLIDSWLRIEYAS